MAKINEANVMLWGQRVGVVGLDATGMGVFEYDPKFLASELEVAPLMMPLDRGAAKHRFAELSTVTYKRLPGMLADALPDKFGQAIVDNWLARQGRSPKDFSVIERLCYTGSRAMGALEFEPADKAGSSDVVDVDLERMVELVREIIDHRTSINETLVDNDQVNEDALMKILMVGTSAGGARAKAVIAYNEKTGAVKSGQAEAPDGFEHWLLKFDGAGDIELGKTGGFGRIEHAYWKMAMEAGIDMMECRLLEEHGRAHFMTRRFDRVKGEKIHMQSLCAIAHYDFNERIYGYEMALQVMRRMRLPVSQQTELYRRMVFNVMARNQDDHTKNIAFLMDATGQWKLSPAYDMTYSYNPSGEWTYEHQMTVNGKRSEFTIEDLLAVAKAADISKKKAEGVIEQVRAAIQRWDQFGMDSGVPQKTRNACRENFRLL